MNRSQPVYKKIEFCRSPKSLWGKIKSGRYDWLGVKNDGTYVLGSPSRGTGFSVSVTTEAIHDGASDKSHYVTTETPGSKPDSSIHASAASAKAAFDSKVATLRQQGEKEPILCKIELFVDNNLADEKFLATTPPTFR